ARDLLACTAGPLLGMFLVALAGRGNPLRLAVGAGLSFLLAFLSIRASFLPADSSLADFLARLPLFELVREPAPALQFRFAPPWATVAATLLTMLCGWEFRKKNLS